MSSTEDDMGTLFAKTAGRNSSSSDDSGENSAKTSTPRRNHRPKLDMASSSSLTLTSTDSHDDQDASQLTLDPSFQSEYAFPVLGYEVMEQRAKFTVFRIQVQHKETSDQWFIYRRYTDFARLNKKLREQFPGLRLALPSKKWFGDNFDPNFLEDRMLGLQAFINNVTGHREISQTEAVREFFCLDDPPDPHDNLEDSRALCENLEQTVANLKKDLKAKTDEIMRLKHQVFSLQTQLENVFKTIRNEKIRSSTKGKGRRSSRLSLNEVVLTAMDKPAGDKWKSTSLAELQKHNFSGSDSEKSEKPSLSPGVAELNGGAGALPPVMRRRGRNSSRERPRSMHQLLSITEADGTNERRHSDVGSPTVPVQSLPVGKSHSSSHLDAEKSDGTSDMGSKSDISTEPDAKLNKSEAESCDQKPVIISNTCSVKTGDTDSEVDSGRICKERVNVTITVSADKEEGQRIRDGIPSLLVNNNSTIVGM